MIVAVVDDPKLIGMKKLLGAMDLKDAEREIYRSHGLGDFAKIP